MAGKEGEELASISALMLDQFTTYNMTGWLPRFAGDEFNRLTLLRRRGRLLLRVTTHKQHELAEIALDDVISYVIKVCSLTVTRKPKKLSFNQCSNLVN